MTVSFLRRPEISGDVAYIELTRGHVAIIDARDAELVGKWNWASLVAKRTVYARRNRLVGDGPGSACILLHRVIMAAPDGLEVDHRNGNGLDNRRDNLRVATHADNMKNTRMRGNNTSGFKGVYWDNFTGRWMAAIGHQGKFKNLGRFDTAEEAHAAYSAAATELFGEFARLA